MICKECGSEFGGNELCMCVLETLNRAVAEWLGLCWHEPLLCPDGESFRCVCCQIHVQEDFRYDLLNPNFVRDPVSLLRLMMIREDWSRFACTIGMVLDYTGNPSIYISPDFVIDNQSGLLLRKVWEWKEEI